jgi:hypothetical protein
MPVAVVVYTAPATGVEDARSGKARLKSSQTTAAHRENYDPRRGSGLAVRIGGGARAALH